MSPWKRLVGSLPRGHTLSDADWARRHRLLLRVLAAHVPGLLVIGLLTGHGPVRCLFVALPPALAVAAGYVLRAHRRTSSMTVTAGFGYCSTAIVGLTGGTTEAHFHFFIIIGFIALYQDWAPFLFNIVLTVLSHGIGSVWTRDLVFDDADAQADPWRWALVHGVAVLFACVGAMLFWRFTEDAQREQQRLARRLADTEVGRRQFASDLLTNLARRNQSLLYRQQELINELEDAERDPDALAGLFALDHLTTRVRRNAESLLVLSGEKPPRTWGRPAALRDVLRSAVGETEDLERVVLVVDEQTAVLGHVATDLIHLLAELAENAVRFSPPASGVTVRCRPDRTRPRGLVITVEDAGVGMSRADLDATNALLADPPDIDLSVSQRLGFHVIARLAARHDIDVSLRATPGAGVTAVVMLPPSLFAPHGTATREVRAPATARPVAEQRPPTAPVEAAAVRAYVPATVVRAADLPVESGPRAADRSGEPSTTRAGLRRRVPQSHLYDELRQSNRRPRHSG